MNTLNGTLKNTRYHSDGFLIGNFRNNTGDYTCLGNMVNPEIGVPYKLYGRWTENPKYGRQFQFSSYEADKPKDKDGLIRYLSNPRRLVQVSAWHALQMPIRCAIISM